MFNPFSQLKIQNLLDRDTNKFELHPYRAWAVIFSVVVVLIILVLSAHLYFYAYMHTDSSFKPDDSSAKINEVKLNRKGLDEITAIFEEKNTQFQELLTLPLKIADPSVDREDIGSSVISTTTPPGKKPSVKKGIDTAPSSFE